MKTYSVGLLALLLIACAMTPCKLMHGDSLIARGPTSLVLVRDGHAWGILKDHSS